MSDETQVESSAESSGLDLSQSLSSEDLKVESPQEESEGLDLSKSLEKEDKPEEPQLPEKYDLTYSEDLELLKGIDESLQDAFKEAKLTQEQAQIIANNLNKVDKNLVDTLSKSVDNMYKAWRSDLSKHPLFVGDNLKQSEATIRKGFNAVLNSPEATPEYKEWMNSYFFSKSEKNPNGQGVINNPRVAELFFHIGKALGSDNAIVGKASLQKEELIGDKASLMRARMLKEGAMDSFDKNYALQSNLRG